MRRVRKRVRRVRKQVCRVHRVDYAGAGCVGNECISFLSFFLSLIFLSFYLFDLSIYIFLIQWTAMGFTQVGFRGYEGAKVAGVVG
jgi:hypothetical protein